MNIPAVDSHTLARGNHQLREAIEEALHTVQQPLVSYFFSLVPDRGRRLWGKFRKFQRIHGEEYAFSDYVENVVYSQPISRALMPEGCRRPHRESLQPDMRMLMESLRRASMKSMGAGYIGRLSEEQMLPAFLEEMFFGRGEVYQIIRRHHCVTCPFKRCAHHR